MPRVNDFYMHVLTKCAVLVPNCKIIPSSSQGPRLSKSTGGAVSLQSSGPSELENFRPNDNRAFDQDLRFFWPIIEPMHVEMGLIAIEIIADYHIIIGIFNPARFLLQATLDYTREKKQKKHGGLWHYHSRVSKATAKISRPAIMDRVRTVPMG